MARFVRDWSTRSVLSRSVYIASSQQQKNKGQTRGPVSIYAVSMYAACCQRGEGRRYGGMRTIHVLWSDIIFRMFRPVLYRPISYTQRYAYLDEAIARSGRSEERQGGGFLLDEDHGQRPRLAAS